ncbi:MAG: hypothetical protein IJ428_04345 [Clostridia bacterium]|nr:hypothetical protein [Clostridia bacterium]
MAQKVYVKVNADFSPEGEVRPRSIIWRDGSVFEITAVMMQIRAASTKVGGCGLRYTVRVEGQERYLFRDEDRWFVEGK